MARPGEPETGLGEPALCSEFGVPCHLRRQQQFGVVVKPGARVVASAIHDAGILGPHRVLGVSLSGDVGVKLVCRRVRVPFLRVGCVFAILGEGDRVCDQVRVVGRVLGRTGVIQDSMVNASSVGFASRECQIISFMAHAR